MRKLSQLDGMRLSRLMKRAGGVFVLASAATLAASMFTTQLALAGGGGGNPHFENILDAQPPTGFMSSPQFYDISGGPATVDFNIVVTNLTNKLQTVTFTQSADHILTYNGQDVSDGQPGQPGITFHGPKGTTQQAVPGSQIFTITWQPKQTLALARVYTFDSCGYYQLDVWAPTEQTPRDHETLASGFVRMLGCSPDSTPTGSVSGSGTPTGGTQGVTTPSTGSGSSDGMLGLAGVLFVGGGGMLVAGTRRRRMDI